MPAARANGASSSNLSRERDIVSDQLRITEQYASKIAADLEANRAEQESIDEQLQTLSARKDQLVQDEKALQSMRQALSSTPAPSARDERGRKAKTTSARVPSSRTSGETASSKGNGKPKAKKKAARERQQGPTLRERVKSYLIQQDRDPKSIRDISVALSEAHPTRTFTHQLVRNAAETLVRTGEVERLRQGSSVYYIEAGRPDGDTKPKDAVSEEPAAS